MRTTRLIPIRYPMHRRTGHRAPTTSTQSVSSSTSSSNRALPHMQTKMECSLSTMHVPMGAPRPFSKFCWTRNRKVVRPKISKDGRHSIWPWSITFETKVP
eukprot:scaffold35622_cov47-Attheya_sp.AAC.5